MQELLGSKQLLYYLAWRDLKVRYKQTAIGVGWAVLQPLALVTIFSIFMSRITRFESPVAYPVFFYIGLMFWNLFNTIVTSSANSIVNNSAVVKKIFFPRILMPLSSVAVALVDFSFTLAVFIGMMFMFDVNPQLIGILWFPVVLLLTLVAALGMGFFFAAINVRYRDVKQALPFTMQALFFLTPIIYSVDIISTQLRWLMFFNPMTAVVALMRTKLLGVGEDVELWWLGISFAVAIMLFVVGLNVFRKNEKGFADSL